MARYIRYGGLASILVVDTDHEVDALMDHPDLARDYTAAGPLLNRMILARLRRGVGLPGDVLLSFRPRADTDRAHSQRVLAERLDVLATRQPWASEAVAAVATYVVTGADRHKALVALTYITAYPFLPASTRFQPAQCERLYRLYRRLSTARKPWAGLPLQWLGIDKRAAQQILQTTNGDEYGLHAIGITLDNSVLILDHLRARYAGEARRDTAVRRCLDWSKLRTAPALVVRQTKQACRLPDVPVELPAHTLVLLQMRHGLRNDSPAGFEFASSHWSACPASRYMISAFAAVGAYLPRAKD